MLDPPPLREPIPRIFDLSGTERQVIWHDDPYYENLVVDLVQKLKPDRFVETGTYRAGLVRWFAKRFPELEYHSIEFNAGFYAESMHWSAPFKNVHLYRGLSQEWLRSRRESLSDGKLTFFYLDAHSIETPIPLREECEAISPLEKYICVLDDIDTNYAYEGPGINYHEVKGVKGFERPYVPAYPMAGRFVGYAMYVKGVDYTPPNTVMQLVP